MKRMDDAHELREIMGSGELLDALIMQMSDDEATKAFTYIRRMYDIPGDEMDE